MSDTKTNENANASAEELETLRAEKEAAEAELAELRAELAKAKSATPRNDSDKPFSKVNKKNFRKVNERDYASGTYRTTEKGLIVFDS